MSLQVWLPMTKDLRNQGLSDVTVTNNGATYNATGGKLGGCYEFASGKRIQTTLPASTSLNAKAISLTCWINITSWNSSYDAIMSIADGTSWQNSRATLSRNNTASTLIWNIANGNTSTRISTTTNLSTNIWYHIACTYDGANLKIYLNGVLDNSAAATLSISYAGTFNIGGWSGNNYPINAKLNDVRIYNHCLSPMEVKQLSQGLVLHYPLDNNGFGNENLIITNSMAPLSGTSGWSSAGNGWRNSNVVSAGASNGHAIRCTYSGTTQVSGGIHHPTGVDKTTLTTGAIYTLSARIRASKACIATFYNELMTTGNTINLTTEWQTYSFSSPIDNSKTYHSNTIYVQASSVEQNMWIECDWIKLEEGAKSTPWCPNSADELATTIGMNDGIEYDCSGFGNNGEKTTTINYSSNSARYMCSYEFNSTDRSNIYFPNEANPPEEISISLWGYKNNWNVAERLAGKAASSSGWCIGDYGNENTMFGFFLQSGSGGYNTISGFRQLSSGWHHFVITFDGYNLKYYLDGECISTKTWESKQKLQVGTGKYNIGSHTNNSYFFNGNMNDFRIYATALSASDVLSLYQNSAYIDSSGNVYGAVHSEV